MVVGDLAIEADVVVLGAGPGGYVAALRAAQLGRQVVLVDPQPPGGTCLREGCIPSKALLTAVSHAHNLPNLAEMGITVGETAVDWGRMQRWKEGVVAGLSKGVGQLLKGNGVEVVVGNGRFVAPDQLWVESEYATHRFAFDQAVLATGAAAAPWPGLPFDGQRVLTPVQALQLAARPETLTVIGSDYIAAEIATIFAKLGTAVTLWASMTGDGLLPEFDPTVGRLVGAQLRKLGVKLPKGAVEPPGEGMVVVSNGVVPRTAGLDLPLAGVEMDGAGFVRVNGQMQTSNPNLFAVGDVTGHLPLATLAIKQGKVAAEVMGGKAAVFAPQAIPRIAWTDPEVAAVGLTAAQAEGLGYGVVNGRFPLAANGRAQTLNAANGVVLTVAEAGTELLLGVTIIAPHASDLIGEAALAIEMGATLTDLAETLHPHPGLGEALLESAEGALGRAVHVLMR